MRLLLPCLPCLVASALLFACSRAEAPPPAAGPAPAPIIAAPAAPAPAPAPVTSPPPAAATSRVLPPGEHGKPQALLIMPLHPEAGLEASGRALDEMLLAGLAKERDYQVLGPADINAMLGVEKLKDAMGCDDVSCAAEIGGALGSRYLVAGQIGSLGDQAVLSLRLMDTRDGKVLSRASARGGRDAEALSSMAEQAMGDLLGIEVKSSQSVAGAAPTQNYPAYQTLLTQLGGKMGHADYTGLLALIDAAEKKSPQAIPVPAGQDLHELLTYYRGTACFMLKQYPCFDKALATYNQRWPQGAYGQGLASLENSRQTQLAQQQEKEGELSGKLADLQQQRKAGHLNEAQALEIEASIYMGALSYKKAETTYATLMGRVAGDEEKWFQFLNLRSIALQQLGEFATLRKILEDAKSRNPRRFAALGMNQTLSSLPH